VPERILPAWQLFEPDLPSAKLRQSIAGNIVLIGTSAVGLKDLRATPLNPFEAGVVVHAQLIEQMLLGWYLHRPVWAGGAEILVSAALGVLLILLLPSAGARSSALFGLIAIAGVILCSWFAYARAGLLIDPIPPVLAFLTVHVIVTFFSYLRTEREKGQLRAAFSQYLAPALVSQLMAQPERLKLGGETREMTFLFSDIAGFTRFAETTEPALLVDVLNAYLDGQCDIVMSHGGTVDKIVGDAVHAIFNAPIDQPDHAERALVCALAMDDFATAFAARLRERGIDFGRTRIGINTGRAIVGNFGGARRFDYTAHGDAINTAARLEGANKHLGTRICVAATTAAACPDRTFRPIGTLRLAGKQGGIDAFEPLLPDEASAERVAAYLQAYRRLEARDPAAVIAFADLATRFPNDPLIALHARRIAGGETGTMITLSEK
jgi:adenylate cyclase